MFRVLPVSTCWMSASVARSHSFFHIGKRRIGKAIRTKHETFAFSSSRTIQQLEIVKRALQLLVQFDSSVLWQHVGFVTILTIQTSRFCHDILHVPALKKCCISSYLSKVLFEYSPATFPTSRKWPTTVGQTRKTDLKKLIHAFNIFDEILKFQFEDFQCVFQDGLEVSLSLSNQIKLFFNC